MDTERTLETLRLRLLRLGAGLLAAVVFLSVAPFSLGASRWIREGILSVLSRAELAAQYLVIAQARVLAAGIHSDVDHEQLLEFGIRGDAECGGESALSNLRGRLEALRAVLEDLPRHGLRLLRRIEKRVRRLMRAARLHHAAPRSDLPEGEMLCAWRLVDRRIERPPDKEFATVLRL